MRRIDADTIDYFMGLRAQITATGELVFFHTSGKVFMRFDGARYEASMEPGVPETDE